MSHSSSKIAFLLGGLCLWSADRNSLAVGDTAESAKSCASAALHQPLEVLNSTHSFTFLHGSGRYKGKHRIVLSRTQVGLQAHVTTRLTHVLVDRSRGNEFVLPHGLAVKLDGEWKEVLDFIAAALRSDWRAIEEAFDHKDFYNVLGIWLSTSDAELFSRVAPLNASGGTPHLAVFRVLRQAIQGCYPGVEKISACENLDALLPVLVRGALDYRMRASSVLSKLLTKGSKAWHKAWFAPAYWAAHQKKKLFKDIVRELAPGVFAFPLFTARFALQLASELRSFRKWTSSLQLPQVSKNRFITLLDELRAETYFDSRFLRRFITPIVAEFLPLEYEEGVDDRSYAFIRYYSANDDPQQYADGVHHDESTVTLNVPLSPPRSFIGGNLSFCGMFGFEDYRKHIFTLDWSAFPAGYAVIHAGLRRHAASSLAWGERMNLVVWGISATPNGVSAGSWETKQTPDPECLSRLYDTDFKKYDRLMKQQ